MSVCLLPADAQKEATVYDNDPSSAVSKAKFCVGWLFISHVAMLHIFFHEHCTPSGLVNQYPNAFWVTLQLIRKITAL